MHALIFTLLAAAPADAAPGGFPELPELKEYRRPALQEEATEPKWTGSITLGLGWVDGNTKSESLNTTADAEYRRENDRTTLGLLYAYKEEFGVKTEDKYSARAQYDYFINEKTYALGQGSYETDTIAALKRRITVGAGFGHQFREDEEVKLNGEAGLSYVDEEYKTSDNDYIAARLAYNGVWAFREGWEASHSLAVFPAVDNVDDYYLTSDARLKANLTESMFGQLQYLFDHDNTPASGAKKSDHKVTLSLGWGF
jgi:putative salt-induced outer membrane protein YdiY